jgi:SAM-dependent methyltransferase
MHSLTDMTVFDHSAEGFAFWVQHVDPRAYESTLASFLPSHVESALDVGCGTGFLSFFLADLAKQVVGLDRSAAMIRIAARSRPERREGQPHFVIADLGAAPFRTATFDLVVANAVVHSTRVAETLSLMRNLLKPGGRLFVRDVVVRNRRRSDSVAWQLASTLGRVPTYLRRFGLRTTWALLRFEASPAWVRHRAERNELTMDEFRRTYERHLPGCSFVHEGAFMCALWVAPGRD